MAKKRFAVVHVVSVYEIPLQEIADAYYVGGRTRDGEPTKEEIEEYVSGMVSEGSSIEHMENWYSDFQEIKEKEVKEKEDE